MARLKFALALALACVCSFARPQDYPSRTLHMIIPFAPGGASDFVGRIIQPKMSELLGRQIVIENRGGAAGNIGMEAAAKADPDGYTIFLGNIGTIAINAAVFRSLAINPMRDFIAVTEVVDVPGVLIASKAFPPNSVREVVAYAKAHPGKLNYGSPGSGSQNRLEMELFRQAAGGLDMVHIPYKGGAGPAVTGLIAGETHLMFTTAASALPYIKGGRLKALAVTSAKRIPALPDTPTMVESGFPRSVTGSWQGIFVPAGTPRPVVDRLFAVTRQVMQTKDVVERLAGGGAEVVLSDSPEAFADFVAAESQRWGRVAREVGATVD
ncbi:MAG TPA: tripartite tricarboxylate transporter substrate binding protein [Burkholderiales bacterium]|nr:tripartite tricarboxylate transporter substrate binding protein [Burkholderiales bacterium]